MAHSRRTTRLEELFIDPTASLADDDEGVDLEDVIVVIRPAAQQQQQQRLAGTGTTKSLTPDVVRQTGDFAHVICTASGSSSLRAGGPQAPFLRSYSVDCERPPPNGCSTPTTAGGRLANGGRVGATGATASASMEDHRMAVAYARSHSGNVRRWSQTLQRGALRNGKQTIREKTINFMPSRLNVTLDDGVDGAVEDEEAERTGAEAADDTEVERLTHEIEQHEHLMDLTAQSEQQRM